LSSLAAAVSWCLLVPAADWLAHHDVGSAKGSLLQAARGRRGRRLLTLGAGLFAAGALAYTVRTFGLSREGQVTDRYAKAIEQLGSDKLDVRIGGIYALERVARDSATDHPTVMEVLTAFVREHSREQWPLPERGTDPAPPGRRPDVQASTDHETLKAYVATAGVPHPDLQAHRRERIGPKQTDTPKSQRPCTVDRTCEQAEEQQLPRPAW
jgi:hypothetical protein